MKKNLLLLLGVAVMFFSCQNESTEAEEQQQTAIEAEIAAEADILTSEIEVAGIDEGDDALQMNAESEILVKRPSKNSGLTFNTASKSQSTQCEADIEGLVASLPETVSVNINSKPGDNAYFNIDILDTNLAATNVPAWCIDVDLGLGVEGPLDFSVYSSYDVPEGKYENPQNFDLVNWILNQDYVGKESASGGTYTFGQVQWAIWELLDDRNCISCTFLTNPTGEWRNDPTNITKGQEIVDAAQANGEGFVPGCGELLGVVLDPAGKQPIMIGKEVPAKEEECDDCKGDVDQLTMKFDWHRAKRVRIYQKKENTCWGAKVFDKVLQPGEEFSIEGVNHDGSFGKYVYIYIDNCYYTKIKTNCYLNIGPGYEKGVFNVISGTSTHGGELCEYVKPEPKCYRHWVCYYFYKYCKYDKH
jgi:hypothetical protein